VERLGRRRARAPCLSLNRNMPAQATANPARRSRQFMRHSFPRGVLCPLVYKTSLRQPISTTRRLGDHQEPHRLIRHIAKSVVRARRHLYALAHGQRNRPAIGLHNGLTAQNVEKLPGFPVAMRHF
jgi:hypothetical protein